VVSVRGHDDLMKRRAVPKIENEKQKWSNCKMQMEYQVADEVERNKNIRAHSSEMA
jgi:hypothetical protein